MKELKTFVPVELLEEIQSLIPQPEAMSAKDYSKFIAEKIKEDRELVEAPFNDLLEYYVDSGEYFTEKDYQDIIMFFEESCILDKYTYTMKELFDSGYKYLVQIPHDSVDDSGITVLTNLENLEDKLYYED